MDNELAFDLDSLAVDVFTLTETIGTIESLTGAHGMTEIAASCNCCGLGCSVCSGSCGGCNPPVLS